MPLGVSRSAVRPTRIERRARLVNAIARGRRGLDEIVSGSVINIEQIATRQKCSVRQVNMTISLAFLAPDLVKAAVEGRLPRGIGVERLRDAPAEWSRQFETLGLHPRKHHPPAQAVVKLRNLRYISSLTFSAGGVFG
jgi:site-specific DNA recombinase